ncbi:MAG: hypothetical protein K8I00_10445, partial [Candidatus Omnitrophica bacterium]|nr:hypothetical protein [Candidatus Omnitrophota bacterium]
MNVTTSGRSADEVANIAAGAGQVNVSSFTQMPAQVQVRSSLSPAAQAPTQDRAVLSNQVFELPVLKQITEISTGIRAPQAAQDQNLVEAKKVEFVKIAITNVDALSRLDNPAVLNSQINIANTVRQDFANYISTTTGLEADDLQRVKFIVPEAFDYGFFGADQSAVNNASMLTEPGFEVIINSLAASRASGDDVIVKFDRNESGAVIMAVTNTTTQPLRYSDVRDQALAVAENPALQTFRDTTGRVGIRKGPLQSDETPITKAEFAQAIENIHQSTTADAPRIQKLLSIRGLSIGKEDVIEEGS